MANPRFITGPRDGIGFRAETFKVDGSTLVYDATQPLGIAAGVVGRAVAMVTGQVDQVRLCGAGDPIVGRLDHIEPDGTAVVQTQGECKLPQGNAVTVVRGNKIVGALGPSSALGFIGPPGADVAGATAAKHRVEDVAVSTAISVFLG